MLELDCWNSLGHHICWILRRSNLNYCNSTLSDDISNEMSPYIYVLGLFMILWIMCKIDRTLTVIEDSNQLMF